jgi:hypothetical protein
MGAHGFIEFVKDETDPAKAYTFICSERQYMDGHDGYNGTISTTHGFTVLQRTPVTIQEARRFAEMCESDEDAPLPTEWRGWRPEKWGTAGALPILDESGVKMRSAKATVVVEKSGYLGESELIAFAASKLTLKPSEKIIAAKTLTDEKKRKVTQVATEGKAVTRYLIVGNYDRNVGDKDGYASMALARAAAKKMATSGGAEYDNPNDSKLEIIGMIRREGGGPLVVTESRVIKRKLVIEVQIARSVGTPKSCGWYFFGLAAS